MTLLRAGPMTARLVGAELVEVKVGPWEALDAAYVAVRDNAWATVPGQIESRQVEQREDGFQARFQLRHTSPSLDFRWVGTIDADAERVLFSLDGHAMTDFEANRIGFALLHPISLTGQRVRAHTEGGVVEGQFSPQISPHQPFLNLTGLETALAPSVSLAITFSGDLFEMEDHRNWTDPGWKTYCTPLADPSPRRYAAGDRVRQAVELRTDLREGGPADRPFPTPRAGRQRRGSGASGPAVDQHAVLTVLTEVVGRFPWLGLGCSGLPELSEAALKAVGSLKARYLHVELEESSRWEPVLSRAAAEALALGLPLDVAVVAEPSRLSPMVTSVQASGASVRRLSVFSPPTHTTDGGAVSRARDAARQAGLAVAVGGGSRANFTELNRGDFDVDLWDFVTYGINPQVHHSESAYLLRTTLAVPDTARQAAALARGRPLVVGPLTLRPRFNAYTGGADCLPDPSRVGPDCDARQSTQLAGTYIVAALTGLVEATDVTVCRTVGPRGIVDHNGVLWPAARAFAALGDLQGAPVLRSSSSHPLIRTVAVQHADHVRLLAVNISVERLCSLTAEGIAVSSAHLLFGDDRLDPAELVLPPASAVVLTGTTSKSGAGDDR